MEELKEGYFYHIYNRGAGRAQIFWTHEDYIRFLKKYWFYMHICVKTMAFCLLKNHFHFLIKIHTVNEQQKKFIRLKSDYPKGTFFGDQYFEIKPYNASMQFRHLFNSHTRYINIRLNRSGTLSEGTFKRKRIVDPHHLNHMICYIHRNPIHHKISRSYSDYPYSSFIPYIKEKSAYLTRKIAIDNFGSKQNFIEAHEEFRNNLGEDFYFE